METRAHFVLIGSFVLMAAAALMLFVVWISQSSFNRDYDLYDVVFEGAVNGLSEGGEVRFNGIKVGEVQRLTLDKKNTKLVNARIRVRADTPVLVDSVAQLDFLGVTGVTFIQIRAGTSGQPPLKTQSQVYPPVIPTEGTALDQLFLSGEDFLTLSRESIQQANKLLSNENVESVSGILANLNTITAKLAEDEGFLDQATSAARSIDRAAKSLDRASASIETAVGRLDQDLAALSPDLALLLKDTGVLVADARKAMAHLEGAIASVESDLAPSAGRAIDQLGTAAGDLRALMIRLQGLAAEIEQNPSRFVYQQPLPAE
jgi:phospholipid/cholesterol/gamma-HCH transport system substrate-binding protein